MSQVTAMDIERIASGRGPLFCIAASATVAEAARKMTQHHIGCLIIIDEDIFPAGILTERDILNRAVAEGRDPSSLSVSEIMTAEVIHCSPRTSVAVVQQVMAKHQIRHVPIVNEGKVVGIMTSRDVHANELAKVMGDVAPVGVPAKKCTG